MHNLVSILYHDFLFHNRIEMNEKEKKMRFNREL